MNIISDTVTLQSVCEEIPNHPFCTVDTEFLRETTFWPKLCLIQIAIPGDAWIVDVLAEGLDLAPFFKLMADERVTKVFHAARQDIEIIHHLAGLIPNPVFDTQVAGMVCGYGDSISYDQLVFNITGVRIDKSSRFTDWSKRPLSKKQLEYALADVTHLRDVYLKIRANLDEQDRASWVTEEMEVLTSQETYDIPPENAWKRLKLRVRKPRDLAVLQSVAEWRERMARKNDVPRGRVIKDDGVYDVASRQPSKFEQLSDLRSLNRGFDRNRYGKGLIEAIERAKALPDNQLPQMPKQKQMPEGCAAATELLKVLLKLISDQHGVAAKIIATVDDLERIAADDEADVRALKGWRRDLFGKHALALKNGSIAIGYDSREIRVIELD